jgi:hypothetical protein
MTTPSKQGSQQQTNIQLFGSMRKELLGAKGASKAVKKTIFVGMMLAMLLHGAEGGW